MTESKKETEFLFVCFSFLYALCSMLLCCFCKTQYISVTVSSSKDAALLQLLFALHSLGPQKDLIYCFTVTQPSDILVALTASWILKNCFI